MENRGVEFELGWKNSAGDFNYFISANASYLQNKLINLGNETGEQIYESAGASGVGSYVKGMNGEVSHFSTVSRPMASSKIRLRWTVT